ncbi:hypothetical protein CR205_19795 [Alteribacter lacisalsi]|uniref:DUF2834 domain-containing protein n=1 Tax=Alteribacter lacisalsi TaxID=2045244 RepID=A0A2W0HPG3_9BACI|nr:hypothetical protein [Alteribacter lacisalsi]PYZ95458.1 hypothetical protein CR205_19795 [Alteribacter lacisalsi]
MKLFLAVWVLLILYTVFLAPGEPFGSDPVAQSLIRGQFEEVDPLITAVFSMLGLYPLIFIILLVSKDRHKVPAWPFAVLSFGLGAFTILPWLAFRGRVGKPFPRGPEWLHRLLLSPFFLLILLFIGAGIWATAVSGSLAAYSEGYFSSHLVSTMTVDFIVVLWITWYLARYEWQLRHAWLAFIPAVGILMLLLFRKRLKADGTEVRG